MVHNMTDPRSIAGWAPQHWSTDERLYVQHLDQCERQSDPASVTVLPGDPALVVDLIALADALEGQARTFRNLVPLVRMRSAAARIAGEGDDPADAAAVQAVAGSATGIGSGA